MKIIALFKQGFRSKCYNDKLNEMQNSMVIVIGNRLNKPNSNSDQDYLHFTSLPAIG